MKDKLVHSSFILGIIIFVTCALSILVNAGQILLAAALVFPGFLFGFVLITINNSSRALNKIALLILSSAIYILCVFLLDITNNTEITSPFRLLLASVLGAILLSHAYCLLVTRVFSVKRCIVFPILYGIVSCMVSCLSMYFLHVDDHYGSPIIETMIWAGILSIFPMWMTLISFNIVKMRETGIR